MEDLIACLYPHQDGRDYASKVVNALENKARFVKRLKEKPELPGRRSRESTAPLDEHNKDSIPAWHYEDGLQLTFSHKLKSGSGIVLGTDSNSCDIVLPALSKISRRHCYLTFDEQRRLVVRDCSRHGTIVKYDQQGGEKRRMIVQYDRQGREKRHEFTWIIGSREVPNATKNVIIEIHEELKFQIVVSKPTFIDTYEDNIKRFLVEIASNAELPFGVLGIQSTISTAAASGMHTPKHNPILLNRGILGKGTFSVVSRVWDVSTGLQYAAKEFHNLKISDWRKEAALMRQTSHEHIVRLVFELETPSPRLVLEYLPLGHLEDQNRQQCISIDEVHALLRQSLSALTYLHGQRPSIAHRDIKPQNILVQSRKPFHIKLADFGLSKASDYLETVCGSLLYVAPEVIQHFGSTSRKAVKYTNAVDIWSLAVVAFEYGCGLPRHKDSGRFWCERIVEELGDWEHDDLIDLLSNMLVMDPKLRDSAEICLHKASSLPIQHPFSTPIAESAQRALADEVYDPTIKVPTNDFLPVQRTNSLHLIQDSEIQQYVSSKIPHESAALNITEKRKRLQARSAASSNSFGGRRKRSYAPTLPRSENSEDHRTQSHLFRDSEIDKYIRTTPSHKDSESTLNLFGEGWLKDAKCVGSSVAELWESKSELSAGTTRESSTQEYTADASDHDVVITQNSNATAIESVSQRVDVPNEFVATQVQSLPREKSKMR